MINRSTIYNNNATEENLHNKEPKKKMNYERVEATHHQNHRQKKKKLITSKSITMYTALIVSAR